jgi:hypothetical protein
MMLLHCVRHEQKPGIGRQLCCRNLGCETQREVHLACTDCLGERLLCELDFTWLSVSERCKKLGRAAMIAIDRSCARLDIGQGWIVG